MARSLFDAINAASAALQNATMDENTTRTDAVRPNRPSAKTAKPKAEPKSNAAPKAPSLEDAIAAAAANVGGTKTKGSSRNEGEKAGAKKPSAPKAAPKQDFTCLFDGYLRELITKHVEEHAAKDAIFAAKMKAEGKSMDGCLNYIGGHFYRQAQKRHKSGYVGMGGDDRLLCGMAIHYFDETDEELEREEKEG